MSGFNSFCGTIWSWKRKVVHEIVGKNVVHVVNSGKISVLEGGQADGTVVSGTSLSLFCCRRCYFWTSSGLHGKQRTYCSQLVKFHKSQQYQLIRRTFNVFVEELSPDILKSASKIYGASSGSVVATVALCECDIDDMKLSFFSALKTSFWGHLPGRKVLRVLKNVLNKHLPENAHQLVSGKLHIILTRLHDWRSVLVSEFASKEDLIQALVCSCFVPLYFGLLPPMYRGVRYIDGELGMWRANFVSRTTITVSAFAGEYDICPKDGPAAFFTFQLSDCILQISKRNIRRLQYIFQLPTHQVLDQFYIHGYQDTVSFLKRLSEFGINYLDEDFMLPLTNESCQKGEGTLHWKPETRVLRFRATDPEDVTKENPESSWAADEVEEEASHHLPHHQKAANSEGSECVPTSMGRRSKPPKVYEAEE